MEENQTKTQKHTEVVSKIITILQNRGPTLPIHIAGETGLSMLFANAFLSELMAKKAVKVSNMKIGSSPLYYIPGQEEQLIKFSSSMKGRERDAFDLIQKEGILRDDYLEPAMRVAMRSIKDFAFPLQANMEGRTIIFWRFLTIKDSEAKNTIREMFEKKPEQTQQKTKKEEASTDKKEELAETKNTNITPSKDIVQESENQNTITQKHKKNNLRVTSSKNGTSETENILENKEKVKDNPKTINNTNTEIIEKIRKELSYEGIELLEIIEGKKKDATIKARIKTTLGTVDLLAIWKDKKKLTEIDLTMALQRAQQEKLPCLLITEGELNKKGQEYLEQWKNMLFYKRIKLQ